MRTLGIKIACTILGLVCLSIGWRAHGFPVSALDLQGLCDSSDLIVVGSVGTFTTVGHVPVKIGQDSEIANVKESSVSVLSVLKGTETATTILVDEQVLLPRWGSANLDGMPEQRVRLLFLRRTGDHHYDVTDNHHPSLPGTASSGLEGAPLEQVAGVECQVISNENVPLGARQEAIYSLRRIKAGCIIPTLRQVATTGSNELRLTAEHELMNQGDTGSLSQAIADALSDDASIPGYLQQNILHAIGFGIKDPAAIPLLQPLIRSNQLEARLAAAHALKNIGTPACDPLLRSLLSDTDQQVRYFAVIGLADIAGLPQMHPSVVEFRAHESKYTSYWK